MALYEINNFHFTYHSASSSALRGINLKIHSGDFVLLGGKNGSGKSTLLACLKHIALPNGERQGNVLFEKSDICTLNEKTLAADIGYLPQCSENQFVCEKVRDEICFLPKKIGMTTDEINLLLFECSTYFGIEKLLDKKVSNLSQGEKQLVLLASVLITRPRVLLLDECTAALDSVARASIARHIAALSSDFGITIIAAEHEFDCFYNQANKICVLENGSLIVNNEKQAAASKLLETDEYRQLLPIGARFCHALGAKNAVCNTSEAREFIKNNYHSDAPEIINNFSGEKSTAAEIKNACYKYKKDSTLVIDELSLSIKHGEILALLGANGAGKTTLLRLIAGQIKPQRGKVKRESNSKLAYLSADTSCAFLLDNVYDDLQFFAKQNKISAAEFENFIEQSELFQGVKQLYGKNPFDLSGGEKQLILLLKVTLTNSDIIVLDETTRSLSQGAKKMLGKLLVSFKESGKAVVIATHDLTFAAAFADRAAVLFDGKIATNAPPYDVFNKTNYFTTDLKQLASGVVNGLCLEKQLEGLL